MDEDYKLIQQQNDQFRREFGMGVIPGKIVYTRQIINLGGEAILQIVNAVRNYNTFGADNDPHREHDFGGIEYDFLKIYWKIDYYDDTYMFGAHDPSDITECHRVLTIMLVDEY